MSTSKKGEVVRMPNPAYDAWYEQDQLIVTSLLSSLSPEVLGQVVFMSTLAEVWATLEGIFAPLIEDENYASSHAIGEHAEG